MPPKFEIKAKERIRKGIERYQDVLRQAAQRGINEADTSTLVQSMLVDLLGYDRFSDLTGQFATKGRWADWAVKLDDNLGFFVEVKVLGSKLRDKDLFQVTSYSRQHDLEWAILSTGDVWECHRVAGGQDTEEFFEIRMLDSCQSVEEKIEQFYLLSKEGFSKGAIREKWIENQSFRPEKLAQMLISDDVLNTLRKLVHKDNPGNRVQIDALKQAVLRGVIRGDLNVSSSESAQKDAPRKRRANREIIREENEKNSNKEE